MLRANLKSALLTLGVAVIACGVTDSTGHSARVVFHLGADLNATQGDFLSVADRVQLMTTSGGASQSLTQALVAGESETAFDVEVERGEVRFVATVLNSSGTSLYAGETTARIEAPNFSVTIPVQPVSPVLVVLPAHPAFTSDTSFGRRFFSFTMNVRNPGLDSLEWRVDSLAPLPQDVTISCELPLRDGDNCLRRQAWEAEHTEPIRVVFSTPLTMTTPPASGIPFVSNVGNLAVPTAP